MLSQSCEIDKPSVSTLEVLSVSCSTALLRGRVTEEGEATVVSKGICWNTGGDPTIESSKTIEPENTTTDGSGYFICRISELTPNTLYYLKAYATNSAGTGYGEALTLTTSQISVPVLISTMIVSSTQTTAASFAYVENDCGLNITTRGVCWSTFHNPTISDSKTLDGTGKGSFISSITGLTLNTKYFLRAYATNSEGTGYGDEIFLVTKGETGAVSDVSGNTYSTIQIGTQIWMSENLKTSKFNDNSTIQLVTDGKEWVSLSTPGYCWYNNDADTYKAAYGALYNGFSVAAGKLCPVGWHVPAETEWSTLTAYLGGSGSMAKLKEAGITHWARESQFSKSTNLSGFTALPGGFRSYYDGKFLGLGSFTYLSGSNGFSVYLDIENTGMGRGSNKNDGLSVRCLKNN